MKWNGRWIYIYAGRECYVKGVGEGVECVVVEESRCKCCLGGVVSEGFGRRWMQVSAREYQR